MSFILKIFKRTKLIQLNKFLIFTKVLKVTRYIYFFYSFYLQVYVAACCNLAASKLKMVTVIDLMFELPNFRDFVRVGVIIVSLYYCKFSFYNKDFNFNLKFG